MSTRRHEPRPTRDVIALIIALVLTAAGAVLALSDVPGWAVALGVVVAWVSAYATVRLSRRLEKHS